MQGNETISGAEWRPQGMVEKTWPVRSWRYDRTAACFLILNAISAILFIGLINRPIYDDVFNMLDVHRYVSRGISIDTLRSQVNAPGPTSFLCLAAVVRVLEGNELRDARVGALLSWLLLGGGILVGARRSRFPQFWYIALLVSLVAPHALTATASVLTEGPALFFAVMGVLIWVESVSRPVSTLRLALLAVMGGMFMGIAVTCRQYYLMLLPAAVLVALRQSRQGSAADSPPRFVTSISSIVISLIPAFLLILIWKGFTSPGVGHGTWDTKVGISLIRPIVAAFYVALYLVPLTFPAMSVLWAAQRWRALTFAAIAAIGTAQFRTYLLQPGPLKSLVHAARQITTGEYILFGLISFVTIYNVLSFGLVLWQKRANLLSSPPAVFASLATAMFIIEQVGVGGNMPFYERYMLQLAPFLGIFAFSVMPRLTSPRLLALVFLSAVSQVMLWRYAVSM